jgi:predicted ATPase
MAKSWELRASMSMARLWRDQGKQDEVRDLLAPVSGWFAEGFNTLDLKAAKASSTNWRHKNRRVRVGVRARTALRQRRDLRRNPLRH